MHQHRPDRRALHASAVGEQIGVGPVVPRSRPYSTSKRSRFATEARRQNEPGSIGSRIHAAISTGGGGAELPISSGCPTLRWWPTAVLPSASATVPSFHLRIDASSGQGVSIPLHPPGNPAKARVVAEHSPPLAAPSKRGHAFQSGSATGAGKRRRKWRSKSLVLTFLQTPLEHEAVAHLHFRVSMARLWLTGTIERPGASKLALAHPGWPPWRLTALLLGAVTM